ncbi:MAG: hypothetical protein IKL65_01275 [Bacilli bacterium]|nr:hypothetical protein [Bacilli bacterium]
MDKKKIKEVLLLTSIAIGYKYGPYELDLDDKYLDDEEVTDCEFKLYMLLLTTNKEEQDKLFNEFEELFKKLSKEKQEYIRERLRKIFEEQDKNNKEKEKKL